MGSFHHHAGLYNERLRGWTVDMLLAEVMKDLTANTKYYYMVGGDLAL